MMKHHSFQVRRRAIAIWQKLGYNPWEKPRKPKRKLIKSGTGDFYRGAFDGIPFLNEDSKRTFRHILMRPGYMIRDYIQGEHEKYLAPLTSLIVFFSFFALVSAILQPVQQKKTLPFNVDWTQVEENHTGHEELIRVVKNTMTIVDKAYLSLHLDEFPDQVDNQQEATLAVLEGTLRGQGIPLFLSKFFFLWFAMSIALRRRGIGMSACATASAYVLCQFCCFMMIATCVTFGKSTTLSVSMMLLLLFIDYRQWLGTDNKTSLKLTVSTGILYGLLYLALLVVITAIVLLIAYLKH